MQLYGTCEGWEGGKWGRGGGQIHSLHSGTVNHELWKAGRGAQLRTDNSRPMIPAFLGRSWIRWRAVGSEVPRCLCQSLAQAAGDQVIR